MLGVEAGPDMGLMWVPTPRIAEVRKVEFVASAGCHGGLFTEVAPGATVGLRIGLGYARRQAEAHYAYEFTDQGQYHGLTGRVRYAFHVIELPVLITKRSKGTARSTFHLGTSVNWLFSGALEDAGSELIATSHFMCFPGSRRTRTYVDPMRSDAVTFSLVIGWDRTFNERITLGARFLADMTDLTGPVGRYDHVGRISFSSLRMTVGCRLVQQRGSK